ncbi:hypothetical protein AB5N19_11588 [Seiridium cardinale]
MAVVSLFEILRRVSLFILQHCIVGIISDPSRHANNTHGQAHPVFQDTPAACVPLLTQLSVILAVSSHRHQLCDNGASSDLSVLLSLTPVLLQKKVLLDVGLQKHTRRLPPRHAFSAELRLDLNLTARQILVDILSSPPKPKTASEMLDLLSYICGLPGDIINRPILMRVWANHAVTREIMGASREELLYESQSVVVDVGGYKLIWAFTNAWDIAEEAIWKKGGSCLASKEVMR